MRCIYVDQKKDAEWFYKSINWYIFAASFLNSELLTQSAWKGVVDYFWEIKKNTYTLGNNVVDVVGLFLLLKLFILKIRKSW